MTSAVHQDDVSTDDQNPNSTTYASEFDSLQILPLDSLFFSNANSVARSDPPVYSTALDVGFDENEDFELTFGDLDGPFLSSKADDFLISEDLDQTTNSLDLQADREASEGAAVCACSFACSPGSESSAVSCKHTPNEGEFLNYQSSELRTAGRECFSTHSGGWDSKSQRIVNCSSPEHGGSGSDHEFSGKSASSHDLGFGNFDAGVSEGMNFPSSNAVYYDVVVDQKIKSEEIGKICMTKRKKDLDEGNPDLRLESINPQLSSCALNEDEEKRKARLMRNRESAQLSK